MLTCGPRRHDGRVFTPSTAPQRPIAAPTTPFDTSSGTRGTIAHDVPSLLYRLNSPRFGDGRIHSGELHRFDPEITQTRRPRHLDEVDVATRTSARPKTWFEATKLPLPLFSPLPFPAHGRGSCAGSTVEMCRYRSASMWTRRPYGMPSRGPPTTT